MKVLRLYIFCMALTGLLLGNTPLANAQCTDPAGTTGEIIYNETHGKFVGCKADDTWQALHGDSAGAGYVPNAVEFTDVGNDSLELLAPFSGITDSRQFTYSMWFRRTIDRSVSGCQYILTMADGLNNRFFLQTAGGGTLNFRAFDATNTERLNISTDENFEDNNWYHVIASIDLTNPANRHIYVNDASSIFGFIGAYDNTDILFSTVNDIVFGSDVNQSCDSDAYFADVWIDAGTYIDLSVEANRRLFIDANGNPVNLGADGSGPTGSAADLFLSGDTDNWHTNKGTGAGFTELGTLETASTVPNKPNDPCAPSNSPASGQVCEDGSIFVGDTDLFIESSHGGPFGLAWATISGNNDIIPDSTSDGQANFENFQPADFSGHPALEVCSTKLTHGHDDWFTPSRDEALLVCANKASINPGIAGNWWSSTEDTANNGQARRIDMTNCLSSWITKTYGFARAVCTRRGYIAPAPCSNPSGYSGEIIYNASEDLFQGCTADGWVALHGEPPYVPYAVKFDGTGDELVLNSALTGVTQTKQVTGSFWFKTADTVDNDDILNITDGSELFRISRSNSNNAMNIVAEAVDPTRELTVVTSAMPLYEWNHVLFSFDLSDTGRRHIYLNGVADSPSYFAYVDAFMRPDTATTTTVGGFPDPNVDLADFWIDFGTYIDFSVAANREKFISSAGDPVFLGDDGSTPTGAAPDIFLSGNPDTWETNKGTGGGFAENGEIRSTISPSHSRLNITPNYTDVSTGWGAAPLYVLDSYAYLLTLDSDLMRIVDISDKTNLTLVGSITDPLLDSSEPGGRSGHIVVGDYAYVFNAATDRIITIDVSDRTNPQIVADIAVGALFSGKFHYIDPTTIILRHSNIYRVYDISDPLNVALVVSHSLSGASNPVFVGNYMYISRSTSGTLDVCNISDVRTSLPCTSSATPTNFTGFVPQLYHDNSHLIAFQNVATAWTFDITDPENPVEINSFNASSDFDGNQGRGPVYFNNFLLYSDSATGDGDGQEIKIFRFVDGGRKMINAYNPGALDAGTRFLGLGEYRGNYLIFDSDTSGLGAAEIVPCQNPTGSVGDIIYNSTEDVYQGCSQYGWNALHE